MPPQTKCGHSCGPSSYERIQNDISFLGEELDEPRRWFYGKRRAMVLIGRFSCEMENIARINKFATNPIGYVLTKSTFFLEISLILSVSLNFASRFSAHPPTGTLTASWNILNFFDFVKW